MEEGTEVEGFIAPVMEIAAAGTAPHASLVHIENELVIRAYMDQETLRLLRDLQYFSEVEHGFVALRNTRRGDPLCYPGLELRRFLRKRQRGNCDEQKNNERHRSADSHG